MQHPIFNVSLKKRGGIRFLKLGRINIAFSVSRCRPELFAVRYGIMGQAAMWDGRHWVPLGKRATARQRKLDAVAADARALRYASLEAKLGDQLERDIAAVVAWNIAPPNH